MTVSKRAYRMGFVAGSGLLSFVLAGLIGMQSLRGAEAMKSGTGFVQDRFAIGFWVDPPMDEKADERYQEIAEANFTLVVGGFGANTPEKAAHQLELCEKYDLKALVVSHGAEPKDLPDGPACWGYKLRDEPNAADFAALRQSADTIRATHPGRMVYVNLFPDYASPAQLGNATYEEHVSRFVEIYDPKVLCMDHYPPFKPGGADGRDRYCGNLDPMRRHSLKAGIPFWNFFNIMPYGPHTDPTEAQVRWQINASLAYGAKGVLYFCYYTPNGGEFPKGGAIIATDDRRTQHWYQAQRINAELKSMGPTLMQLTSTDVRRVTQAAKENVTKLQDNPISAVSRVGGDPELDLLIGSYRHRDGRRAVLLMNYRFAYSAWPTVVFDGDLSGVREISKETGQEIPVMDDSPAMEGLQVSLGAGDARLFLLP